MFYIPISFYPICSSIYSSFFWPFDKASPLVFTTRLLPPFEAILGIGSLARSSWGMRFLCRWFVTTSSVVLMRADQLETDNSRRYSSSWVCFCWISSVMSFKPLVAVFILVYKSRGSYCTEISLINFVSMSFNSVISACSREHVTVSVSDDSSFLTAWLLLGVTIVGLL